MNATESAERPFEFEDEKPPEPEPETPPEVQPKPVATGYPAWVTVPEGFRIPRYRQIEFIKVPSSWTHAPNRGKPLPIETPADVRIAGGEGKLWRVLVCWGLTIGDEKLAIGRAQGDGNRYQMERALQFIRSIDGVVTDWAGTPNHPANPNQLWDDLGPARNVILQVFAQLHSFSRAQLALFFENCFELRSVG